MPSSGKVEHSEHDAGGDADIEFELEVALVTAVDRAVDSYRAKIEGRRAFTDFDALIPPSAQGVE